MKRRKFLSIVPAMVVLPEIAKGIESKPAIKEQVYMSTDFTSNACDLEGISMASIILCAGDAVVMPRH